MNTTKPTIIVCGDIMLDHTIYTSIEKIANEAPIPVFNIESEVYSLGGCGNVLNNLHSLGCSNLYLFSALGNDSNGSHIRRIVQNLGVHDHTVSVDSYNTTTKRRYFSNNRLMFRCDQENNDTQRMGLESLSFVEKIETILQREKIDCIVLSDYNKGVLTHAQCQAIIQLANKYNVATCVDPKEQLLKYVGCTVIKPNKKEAYRLTQLDPIESLESVHKTLVERLACKYSVITLAEKGITLFDGATLLHEQPVVRTIVDVTGAGDIVCSILAYYLSSSLPLQKILKLATRVATKSVEHPGTYTICPTDLYEEDHMSKVIKIHDVSLLRTRYSTKQIIFTNGCFDLLHSGHIELFKYCKSLGDIVVVGLNSDASIRRLKGPTRPVNPVSVRSDILCAIQYIDHVVVFEEDTPLNVLRDLRPTYLVKGGDYRVEDIIGREYATQVVVCNFVKGMSSSNIIQTIVANRV